MCDSTYGLSIGRGSFTWRRGGWTTVKQIVRLNTPGEQDGFFQLEVNGKYVFDRSDIYYRSDPNAESDDDDRGGGLLGILGRDMGLLQVGWQIFGLEEEAEEEKKKKRAVNFVGLFFSTFFGGHDEKYATPKDQHVWFKDFAISYN